MKLLYLLSRSLLLFALPIYSAAAPNPDALKLASVHALVAPLDASEGEVLVARRSDISVPIASVTKLMSAVVVVESGADLDAWLDIRKWDPKPPNNAFSHMRVGSELRRGDLLRLMLQASENLAAHTLARHHPGGFDAFVVAMNETARRLGMTGAQFVEPSGLSPENRASADDLLRLARHAYGFEKIRVSSTSRRFEPRFRSPAYSRVYGNTNRLIQRSDWNVLMSKTGYLSEAGRCLVMVVELWEAPHVVVLLDSFGKLSPVGDAGRIRRWLATGRSGQVAPAAAAYAERRGRAITAGAEPIHGESQPGA